MSDYIPEDFLPEILKRLPVKSLARFRCVSKGWNALICSPSFEADHFACSKARPRLFIDDVYQKTSEETSCVILDSVSHATTFIHNISDRIPVLKALKEKPYRYDLIGSAKGIICFHFYMVYRRKYRPPEGSEILLWNPVINKYMMLPETHTRCNTSLGSIAIGVKPSEEDDLRVVAFHPRGRSTSENVAAEIYSVRQGAWRSLQSNIPKCDISKRDQIMYNGNEDVQWIVHELDDGYSYKLIRFGFEEEEFSCITLPDVLANPNISELRATVYHGRLALLQRPYNMDGSLWRIWTKGAADSWSVLTEFSVEADFTYGITHDGKILMSGAHDDDDDDIDGMVLYNSTTKTCHLLDIHTSSGGVRACPFVESLVFVDGEGGALTLDGVGDQEFEETDDDDHMNDQGDEREC